MESNAWFWRRNPYHLSWSLISALLKQGFLSPAHANRTREHPLGMTRREGVTSLPMRVLILCVSVCLLMACNTAKSDASSPQTETAQPACSNSSTEIGLAQQQIDSAMDGALKIDP